MFNNSFESRAAYEIMYKTLVERGRPQMITARAGYLKVTNEHTGCVILIAFPL